MTGPYGPGAGPAPQGCQTPCSIETWSVAATRAGSGPPPTLPLRRLRQAIERLPSSGTLLSEAAIPRKTEDSD